MHLGTDTSGLGGSETNCTVRVTLIIHIILLFISGDNWNDLGDDLINKPE